MKAFLKGFVYAGRGIAYCLRHERNMRIHFAVMLYLFGYIFLYDFFTVSRTQLAILFLTNAIVIMGECINTAIEKCIDLVEQKYNRLAEISKDTAAGAVLVGAIFAVAVGLAILLQPAAFRAMAQYYAEKPWMLGVLALGLAVTVVFIFYEDIFRRKK